jgi:hypothetical protein
MSIKYITHFQINKEKWDKCVVQAQVSLPYALSFYLDIVAPKWNAIVEEDEDNYLTVMPLTVQTKYGISFLHQPLFCQQLGIFSTNPEISAEKINAFFNIIFEKYRFVSHYHFHTRISFDNRSKNNLFVHLTFYHTHLLDLAVPYAVIYEHYSNDRRLNLKRAVKAKLQIIESEDIEPLILMFQNDIAHKILGGVAKNTYQLLRQIYQELQKRNLCKLHYTQNAKGEINAGALFVFYQNQIIYLFNAACTHARKENGRTLLIDHILKNYANSGFIFDFESPEIEEIARFYQSFGAVAVAYPVLHYNQLPSAINVFWEIKKKIWQLFA